MAHPFSRMFEKALKKSTSELNEVLAVALKLRKKGYSDKEIIFVLTTLQKSLIDENDERLVAEALTDFVEDLD